VKEITDTTSNGFREILFRYVYEDSISIGTESWAYIDGKFYINNLSVVYFDDSLTQDTCSYPEFGQTCLIRIPYQGFNIIDTAQVYIDFFAFHGYFDREETTILPGIGIVKTWHYYNIPISTFYKDSTYLIGIYKDGEFLGDTLFSLTGIDESITSPANYHLSQNYPNPFNPTTTLSYQIPRAGFILFRVYDILGREVATLVNEEKPVGWYEVEFDGTGFASGIYFYRLQAGNFIETKKMILLR